MSSAERACPACGLALPPVPLPYDGYFHASPECWAVFTEVLATEYGNPALFGQVHQLTVDAYAVQHAGGPQPDKSVDVHLVGLHLVLERGVRSGDVAALLQRLATNVSRWPHLELPATRVPLTIFDVSVASSPIEHAARVREWAQQVWLNWRAHHPAVAALAEDGGATHGAASGAGAERR